MGALAHPPGGDGPARPDAGGDCVGPRRGLLRARHRGPRPTRLPRDHRGSADPGLPLQARARHRGRTRAAATWTCGPRCSTCWACRPCPTPTASPWCPRSWPPPGVRRSRTVDPPSPTWSGAGASTAAPPSRWSQWRWGTSAWWWSHARRAVGVRSSSMAAWIRASSPNLAEEQPELAAELRALADEYLASPAGALGRGRYQRRDRSARDGPAPRPRLPLIRSSELEGHAAAEGARHAHQVAHEAHGLGCVEGQGLVDLVGDVAHPARDLDVAALAVL